MVFVLVIHEIYPGIFCTCEPQEQPSAVARVVIVWKSGRMLLTLLLLSLSLRTSAPSPCLSPEVPPPSLPQLPRSLLTEDQ